MASANEHDARAVGRPARLRIVLAIRHPDGSFLAIGESYPDGGLVIGAIVIDVDAGECDTGAVWRYLRIGNPNEVEEIFFGKGALLRTRGLRDVLCCHRRNNQDNHNGKMSLHMHPLLPRSGECARSMH